MNKAEKSLHFAVRPRLIIKYLGLLFLPLAALTCVPLVVTLAGGYYDTALRYGLVIGLLVLVGWPCVRLRCANNLQTNEALVISALVFMVTALLMTYPTMSYGLSFWDALFEMVSAVTTTGLSTMTHVSQQPDTFLFARAWLQWTGGLGVVVLALALMITPGSTTRRLGFDDRETENIVGGTTAHARRVLIIYLLVTLIGCIVLLLLGVDFSSAIIHTLAAVSTGGFSSYDTSLAGFAGWGPRVVVIILCVTGAMSFSWFYGFTFKHWRSLLTDPRLYALLGACLLSSALVLLLSGLAGAIAGIDDAANLILMTFSAQTTAGFSSQSVAELHAATQLALIGAMLVGGEAGSTAGGIKLLRLLVLMRLFRLVLLRTSMPPASRLLTRVEGKPLKLPEIEATVAVFMGYVGVIAASWVVFVAYGHEPLTALFEVVSATGTVGLSAGIVGPDLAQPLKAVLCIDMLMGRLEMLAILILLAPNTWIGMKKKAL
jgi:trk system potassium uptake protein TrkH